MDGLTDEQKIEAWNAAWSVSTSGIALVDKDFQFYRVNNEWLKVLGVPATEFYGKSFSDLTAADSRSLEEDQARLVMDGKISSYLLHKTYHFTDGQKKDVILLVTRMPITPSKPFLFFLCRILSKPRAEDEASSTKPQANSTNLFEFVFKYGKWITGLGIFVGAIFMKYLEMLK